MADHDDTVDIASPVDFSETLRRLTAAMERAGLTIFARIDHAAGACEAGLKMPPTIVLIYGTAKGGTPLMLAAPRAALDLPLRVLVREDGGRVVVSYRPVAATMAAAGVSADLAARLDPAQRLLSEALHP